MLGSKSIKQYVCSLGADLCGVASVDRFAEAPEGFRPADIYPDCLSVIVFARQFPSTALVAGNSLLYSHVYDVMSRELDWIGVELCIKLEGHGVGAVPIPADLPYAIARPERMEERGILSLRHAGEMAGLGVIGKSSLLINKDFGSLIHLGAVLVDLELDPDPLATYHVCRAGCRVCIEGCPQQALDGESVNCDLCRALSLLAMESGRVMHRCTRCRLACPNNHLGI